MISFESDMKKEKLAAIGLTLIIVGALSAFLIVEYKDVILENLNGESETSETGGILIEMGDCADIDFTSYYENGTVWATTYEDVAKLWDIYDETRPEQYAPMKTFVTLIWNETVPEGYEEEYSMVPIDGLMEGLVGLKEGEITTIGPIPPEKAFGVQLKVGDIVNITIGPELSMYGIPDMHDEFIDITENASTDLVPQNIKSLLEMNYIYLDDTTTLYVGKDISQKLGDIKTDFASWENATIATKANDTHIWWNTIPPEDKLINFTWKEDSGFGFVISYWENASTAVINETDNTIVITHNPTIGQKFNITNPYYSIDYTVYSFNETIINCSYTDFDDNTSYTEFPRTITITKNESIDLITNYPEEYLSVYLTSYRILDPDIIYTVGPSANQTIYFDVDIKEVYKTSEVS